MAVLPPQATEYLFRRAGENSKVVNFFFKFYNQTNHVPIGEFKQIPFPDVPKESQTQLCEIVHNILTLKNNDVNANISVYEDKIDKIVYHLYNLTYDEVLIVDPETPIVRGEYES